MKIETKLAIEDRTCGRCFRLGIDKPTILKGNLYHIISNNEVENNCCDDCFKRLEEECYFKSE